MIGTRPDIFLTVGYHRTRLCTSHQELIFSYQLSPIMVIIIHFLGVEEPGSRHLSTLAPSCQVIQDPTFSLSRYLWYGRFQLTLLYPLTSFIYKTYYQCQIACICHGATRGIARKQYYSD